MTSTSADGIEINDIDEDLIFGSVKDLNLTMKKTRVMSTLM